MSLFEQSGAEVGTEKSGPAGDEHPHAAPRSLSPTEVTLVGGGVIVNVTATLAPAEPSLPDRAAAWRPVPRCAAARVKLLCSATAAKAVSWAN